jgi:carboxyl-terminal processing protease
MPVPLFCCCTRINSSLEPALLFRSPSPFAFRPSPFCTFPSLSTRYSVWVKRRLMLGLGALALTAAGFGAVSLAQFKIFGNSVNAQDEAFKTPNGKAFLEAYSNLRENYLKDVSPDKLMKGATIGMVDVLEDQFTYYLEPDTTATTSEDLKGEFFGIGVGIVPANKNGTGVMIDTVFSGQPAAGAGLEVGDVILKVNGEDITKLALNSAVRKIRGPRGTTVKLSVLRGVNRLEFSMNRDLIQKINVSQAMLPGNVGYVRISDFMNQNVTKQLLVVLKGFKDKNVRGVVLDLRDNPGGLVTQAEGVADAFLDKGDVFITRDKSQKVQVEFKAKPSSGEYLGPLVVMVNSGSASASEIVAASFQENGRAKVVGEQTYGKGVANIPTKLANGAQINISFQEWLTPKRNSILKKGVTPDFKVNDSRFPSTLALEGLGAKPGSEIEMKVNGKTVKLKADAQGRFRFQDEAPRIRTSDSQGGALVDASKDSELKKALEVLGVSAVR